MRAVVSVAEMRAADEAAPVGVDVLVRRAGRAVANEAVKMLGGAYGRRVVVVAGKGNNGSDGRAAAALLTRWGAGVTVVDPGSALEGADLVIDAAYGTGFRGEYKAPDPHGAPVLAVDIPSGVDGDTGAAGADSVRAAATVTMAALKPGLLLGEGPERAGRVVVADIGLPVGETATHLVGDEDREWIPTRRGDGNKWDRAVWIVAGSPGMRGASRLCTRAAQRAGAGMCRVGSPGVDASEQPAAEAVGVTLPAEGWHQVVLDQLERFHGLVVGPGLGRSPSVQASVRALVGGARIATLVDADGLTALGTAEDVAAVVRRREGAAAVVLTPHDGEFGRIAGERPGPDRIAAARDLAARTGAVVLLKGSTTVVAAPDGTTLLAAAGDARLATAGTGDVLSGVIGALLCAGVDGLRAAALGAHVHGRAAQRGHAVGLVASDIPDLLPDVLA